MLRKGETLRKIRGGGVVVFYASAAVRIIFIFELGERGWRWVDVLRVQYRSILTTPIQNEDEA